jgi:hypothetical protein
VGLTKARVRWAGVRRRDAIVRYRPSKVKLMDQSTMMIVVSGGEGY